MFSKLFGHSMSSERPVHWYWPIVKIYGGPGRDTVYMTRVMLGPRTPWGRLYLHVFHREDLDRDPHDHPFDFWTFPLFQGYTEEVYYSDFACFALVRVKPWQWSKRAATHRHRIVAADRGWPLVTIVWRGRTERPWGFWCHLEGEFYSRVRKWIPWRDYVYGGRHANVPGDDVLCPGAPGDQSRWRNADEA